MPVLLVGIIRTQEPLGNAAKTVRLRKDRPHPGNTHQYADEAGSAGNPGCHSGTVTGSVLKEKRKEGHHHLRACAVANHRKNRTEKCTATKERQIDHWPALSQLGSHESGK
jgi:hypothetical protein